MDNLSPAARQITGICDAILKGYADGKSGFDDDMIQHLVDLGDLAAHIRDAVVDAERYRYLRDRVPAEVFDARGIKAGAWIDCEDDAGQLTLLTGDDADRTVDEAIRSGED